MMHRFEINSEFEANCVVTEASRVGEIFYVQRNNAGGSVNTPIANYYVWRSQVSEGFHEHWRIDCYVRKHELAPKPEMIGKSITKALVANGFCNEPIWTSWYIYEEVSGEALGKVFELD